MNFGPTILAQSTETRQNFVTRILTAVLFLLKLKSFLKIDDLEGRFDTSNYDKNNKKPILIGKNKKVPGLFKDDLGGKIMTEIFALRPKAYAYLDDDGNKHKKSKGTKRCVIKQKLMFQNVKNCLLNNKTVKDL